MSASQQEKDARVRKAHALCEFLAGQGITAEQAAGLDIEGRRTVAALAHVRPPTDGDWSDWATWDKAIVMLLRRPAIQARAAENVLRLVGQS